MARRLRSAAPRRSWASTPTRSWARSWGSPRSASRSCERRKSSNPPLRCPLCKRGRVVWGSFTLPPFAKGVDEVGGIMITGLSHVSLVVPSLDAAARRLKDVYGLETGAVRVNEEQGVRMAYVELPNARIE